MKKFFAFCLTAALLVCMLTGCRSNVSDTNNGMVDGTNSSEPSGSMPTTQPTQSTQPATQDAQGTEDTQDGGILEGTQGAEGNGNGMTGGMTGNDTTDPTDTTEDSGTAEGTEGSGVNGRSRSRRMPR